MTAVANAPVVMLTPTGRDGELTQRVLGAAGIRAQQCHTMRDVCGTVADDVGVLLLAQEALAPPELGLLVDALRRQPAWSDIPVVVLTAAGALEWSAPEQLAPLANVANLTLLERPVRRATLLSMLRSALRARQRQFEVRRHLDERREQEDVLREARENAEVASVAKTRFLATMSHELRTPLNAIAGYTEIIQLGVHGPVTPEQRSDLERIERNQRYLLSLINDVLNYAKIESGHVTFVTKPFPMSDLIRKLDAFVAPQLAAKGVSYVTEFPDGDCRVCADEEKTQQIMLNLLSNAVKFTPPRGAIRVRCERHEEHARITVSDTGPGVPKEKLESIFEPFVQLGRDLTSSHEGTGLGLSISRDLARKMNGDLTAGRADGGGAVFVLRLPLDL